MCNRRKYEQKHEGVNNYTHILTQNSKRMCTKGIQNTISTRIQRHHKTKEQSNMYQKTTRTKTQAVFVYYNKNYNRIFMILLNSISREKTERKM